MKSIAKEVKNAKLNQVAARDNGIMRITFQQYIARKTAKAKSSYGDENVAKAHRVFSETFEDLLKHVKDLAKSLHGLTKAKFLPTYSRWPMV